MKSKNTYNSKKNKDHCSSSKEIRSYEKNNSSKSQNNDEVGNRKNNINRNKQYSTNENNIKDKLDNGKIYFEHIDERAEEIKNDNEAEINNDNEAEINNDNEAENNNSQNNASVPNRDELFSQLKTLNLSIDTLYIIILATFLNLYYLYSLKAQVSDQLFNTNESDQFIDTKNFPKITNAMFLYSTGIFLDINYKGLEEAKIASRQSNDKRGIIKAWKSFLSSLLVFLATAISRDNLEL
ncbi:hypothetical protein [Clostridium sp. 1001275B_160808_H3]|uniref:hypothetical protein n=1 Tax=Clostridium sp. 1001275B_160808_H3 TaxID=2787110 RepID=UPI00189800E0|nr:hypothetical protein [Clostridium sp. 1001275B_160808_H3]